MHSHCFKLHPSYLISLDLSDVGQIFWVKSDRTVCKFRKSKTNFCVVLTYSMKRAREIKKVSCRGRATTAEKSAKQRDARAKFFFCQSKPIVSLLFAVAVAKTPYCCNPFLAISMLTSVLAENGSKKEMLERKCVFFLAT